MRAWKSGLVGCSAVVLLFGCKKDPEVPPQPVPTPMPIVTEPPPPPEPSKYGPCMGDVASAMELQIRGRATTEAPNTKNELGYTCVVVREGETASVPVFLQPGGCYTFLAHSFPEVTEVDLALKPDFGPNPMPLLLPFANTVIAQDGDSGPQAAIGRKECFKNPLPFGGQAKIEVRARVGEGPIAVMALTK